VTDESALIGKVLRHYTILERIGGGGMGVVYRAQDGHLDRFVAIKILPHESLADEAARKRFRREALALSKLNHPNIATVFDFDSQDGMDFLVMEYVAGSGCRLSSGGAASPRTKWPDWAWSWPKDWRKRTSAG